MLEFTAYLDGLLGERQSSETDSDLLRALTTAEGERMTTEELASNVVMLLFAGHETTTNLITLGMLELLRHRDQWERLCADPGLAPSAVEELFRWLSPVQWVSRIAAQDFSYGGVEIPRGREVLAMAAAANRDPAVFADPETLDIGRTDARHHLGLGVGAHFCLGASLARLEGRVALTALARRFPRIELAMDDLRWHGSALLRTVAGLPVAPNA
jgi:cytochrome P450